MTQISAIVGAAALGAAFVAGPAAAQHQHEHKGKAPERLGAVAFSTTCAPAVSNDFNRAVALLHSFWFGAAADAFTAVAAADPACAMAQWGLAMSSWGNPFGSYRSPAGLAAGRQAATKGASMTASPREQAFIAAVGELYKDYERVDQRTRVVAYETAMEKVQREFADDVEARIFYAVALDQSALPSDKSYKNQLAAAEILNGLAPKMPNHPGIAHYLIHTYDSPALASRGLDAARRYATIAPDAPHALHMPSHTFTRVGLWQESIDTNLASAGAAAREHSVVEQLHALDYQTYAYLQTAQDSAVVRVMGQLEGLAKGMPTARVDAAPIPAGYYALAAIPARYALERGDWAAAASLTVRPSSFPWTDAITHYARALGAARSGQPAAARADAARLLAIRDELQPKDAYWAEQVEIARLGAEAWIAFAEGRRADAITTMAAAADREDKTEKAAVTPGPLAPARELLGEMLLEAGRPADALAAFETTVAKEPNRFRGVYGAGRAAEQAGDRAKATRYYRQLLEITAKADPSGRTALTAARAFLAKTAE
jgi:tetratricopeptide (TPR) repeat protein